MNVLGIIFSYAKRENLRELTKIRTLASLPIGGKYRIIDLLLSNYVNSGVTDVSIITQNNYHSLIDHLGSGKEWDLTRKRGGLRVLTPFASPGTGDHPGGFFQGSIEALAGNMHSLRRSMEDYVIMSGSSMLYNMDFERLLDTHISTGADITAVYAEPSRTCRSVPVGVPIYHMDDQERICDLTVNTEEGLKDDVPWGMFIFVLRKSLLESLVADAMSYQRYDFEMDIIKRLAPTLYIRGYRYEDYVLEISSVTNYMEANMNLLHKSVYDRVFAQPIYTKIKDSVPVYYGNECYVKNSLISDGCRIEGVVENSVLSRGVRVGKGSVVRNSIVMQNTEIMQNVSLNHVILDKDVIVRENRQLAGHVTYPVVIEKLSIV
ncbi:glucose-1-phosphate adenylyltransferase subunit GlgD [Bacilliculturomica massiliensis]|uniref:glucose-1-phosphate adenylyltransferase subunit GlgD n=1 Tax=Bacilliculturomica massiliensis TaxID=1917867 RepID=UPI0013EF56BA|nr:glucose-1-phosphate adenylyltransferase subunit GlgD [Bacilliculturomica massiliensis]